MRRLSAGVTGLVFGVMALVAVAAAETGAQSGAPSGAKGAAKSSGGDAAAAKKHYGTWSGTWEGGGGKGGIEVTFEGGKDGKPGGNVSVTGEPTYKATFKTLSFEGGKMTATYDFPPDPAVLVTLAGTFEDAAANGTWSVKGGQMEPQGGTWTAKKK